MEIKPQELRIGNIIWSVEAKEPTEIFLMGIHRLLEEERDNKPRSYKPIELTPEWLQRFGFKKEKTGVCWWSRSVVRNASFGRSKTNGCFEAQLIGFFNTQISTVHQLQNLFYSLTGEELAIDKTSLI